MTSVVAWVSSALMLVGLVFANVEVGSVVPRVTLKGSDEVACSLVDAQRVTAFLFFDPEQAWEAISLNQVYQQEYEKLKNEARAMGEAGRTFFQELNKVLEEAMKNPNTTP